MRLKHWHIIGFLFTFILGTLLHFTYEWLDYNKIAAIFSAVNESTWEHLKLLFVPMTLLSILEYFIYGKLLPNFIPVRFLSILLGMGGIIVSFYTYTGIVGRNFLWADIVTFILGITIAYWFSFCMLQTEYFTSSQSIKCGWIGSVLLMICFIVFTFQPPHIGLFMDPVVHLYGIS